jgi:hypothetical protein
LQGDFGDNAELSGMIPPFYSPLPEYPVACRRDEWRGEPRRSSKSEGGLAMAQFRLIPHRKRWGASFRLSIFQRTTIVPRAFGFYYRLRERHDNQPRFFYGLVYYDVRREFVC